MNYLESGNLSINPYDNPYAKTNYSQVITWPAATETFNTQALAIKPGLTNYTTRNNQSKREQLCLVG